MFFSADHILLLLTQYRYAVIFPIAVIEGPMVMIASGLLVSLGTLYFWTAYPLLVLADLVGDTMYYLIGYWSNIAFFRRLRHFLGMNEQRLETLEKHFLRHDWKILLFGKTQPIGGVMLVAAGVIRMSYARFIWYNFLGTAPKTLLFIAIGYFFGYSYASAGTYLSEFGWASMILAIALIALYWAFKKYISKNKHLNE